VHTSRYSYYRFVISTTGTLVSLSGAVSEIQGLSTTYLGGVCYYVSRTGTGYFTVVSIATQDTGISIIGAFHISQTSRVNLGLSVKPSGILSIFVGNHILGGIIDALGNIITQANSDNPSNRWIIESPAVGIISRRTVSESLSTGLIAIDSIVPIGLGQRELVVGDRQTGKSSISVDCMLNQKYGSLLSVYTSIGQKSSGLLNLYLTLSKRESIGTASLLSASASTSSVSIYLSPYSASSLCEYFMITGESNVYISYDDLSKQAMSYRELYLLLKRPPGREAYPGEIFFVHSRLLERSAKLNYSVGGGSISSFPIVETLSQDVSSYITTNVISITDGQIFLSTDLFLSGIKPALDVGLSVTRVGSSAQWYGMKLVSGSYKLVLAQFAELQAFSQFTSDVQDETKQRLAQGNLLVSLLKQPVGNPISEIVALYLLSASNSEYFTLMCKPNTISTIKLKVSSLPNWLFLYSPSRLSLQCLSQSTM